MRKEVIEFAVVVALVVICPWSAIYGHYYVAGACFLAAFGIAAKVLLTAYHDMCK